MTTASLESMIQKVGGDKNATLLVAAGGAGLVWFIGRRKLAKSQQAPVSVMAQGYADNAQDPTQLYTGYDQLQQEIDALRGGLPGQGSGVPNPNPVPVPVSSGSPTPVAPIPAEPNQQALIVQKLQSGQPLAPAQIKALDTASSAMGGPTGPLRYGGDNYGPGPGVYTGDGYGPGPSAPDSGGGGGRRIWG